MPVIKSKVVKTYSEFLSGVDASDQDDVDPISQASETWAETRDYTSDLNTVGELLSVAPLDESDDEILKEAAANIAPEKLLERTANVVDDGSEYAKDITKMTKQLAGLMPTKERQPDVSNGLQEVKTSNVTPLSKSVAAKMAAKRKKK